MGQAAGYNSRKSRSNYKTNKRITEGICNGGWTIIIPTRSVDQCWMDPCIGSKDDETDSKREVIWKVIKIVAQLALLLFMFLIKKSKIQILLSQLSNYIK